MQTKLLHIVVMRVAIGGEWNALGEDPGQLGVPDGVWGGLGVLRFRATHPGPYPESPMQGFGP